MLRSLVRATARAVIVVAIAHGVAAQSLPVRSYQSPVWTSAEGFTVLVGLRELKDGRVLVADRRQNEVWLLSATGASVSKSSRRGEGPGEYSMVKALVALPGDSTLIVDQSARHYVLLGPDGKAVKSIQYPAGFDKGGALANGSDGAGRIYFLDDEYPLESKPTGPLLRWDRRTNKVDTVATIRRRTASTDTVGDRNVKMTVTQHINFFDQEDAWGVHADGSLMLLRGEELRMDRVSPKGVVTQGTALPIPRIPLNDQSLATLKELKRKRFPKYDPAFEASEVKLAYGGEVWIRDGVQASKEKVSYLILNDAGKAVARASLPKGRVLMGVTATRVYAKYIDADHLMWVEAYKR